jgi:hypothetical protein
MGVMVPASMNALFDLRCSARWGPVSRNILCGIGRKLRYINDNFDLLPLVCKMPLVSHHARQSRQEILPREGRMRADSDIVRMLVSDSPSYGSGRNSCVVFSFNSMI